MMHFKMYLFVAGTGTKFACNTNLIASYAWAPTVNTYSNIHIKVHRKRTAKTYDKVFTVIEKILS